MIELYCRDDIFFIHVGNEFKQFDFDQHLDGIHSLILTYE